MMEIEAVFQRENHLLRDPIKVECHLCTRGFGGRTERNAHILEHFVREICSCCNKILLRIGDELYVRHSFITCVSDEAQCDGDKSPIFRLDDSCPTTDEMNIKIEDPCIEATNDRDQEWSEKNNHTQFSIAFTPEKSMTEQDRNQPKIPIHTTNAADKVSRLRAEKNVKKYKCKFEGCGELVSKNCLSWHKAKHNKNKFECNICKRTFSMNHLLRKHMKQKHEHTMNLEVQQSVVEMRNEPNIEIQAEQIVLVKTEEIEINKPTIKIRPPDSYIKKYKCTFVGCDALLSLNNRSYHMSKHKAKNFECDVCKKKFHSGTEIHRHILEVHVPKCGRPIISREEKERRRKAENCVKKYKCQFEGCDELVSKNNWSRHKAKHNKNKFECNICRRTFSMNYLLRNHMKQNHEHTINVVEMGNEPNIEIQAEQIFLVKTEEIEINEPTIEIRPPDGQIKKYKCTFAGCDALLSLKSRRYHMSKHKERSFECDICKKKFHSGTEIRRHILEVHVPKYGRPIISREEKERRRKAEKCVKKYKCQFEGCDELVSSNGRAHHMAKHIPREDCFECDICKKNFPTKHRLFDHILNKHNPTGKKFKCELCPSRFIRQNLLDKHHRLTHLKERNFMCNECGKRFKTNGILKSHIYLHTGEKPYQCLFEGCPKSFRTISRRNEHMRSHTGEKPYSCPIEGCNRKFAYPIDLKRHKFNAHRIFTKKYPCQICSEVFPENILRAKHMEQHENLATGTK